jgi:hypothetical protein
LGPLLSRSLVHFYVEYIRNNIATTPIIPSTPPLIPSSLPNYSLNYHDKYVEMNDLVADDFRNNSNNKDYLNFPYMDYVQSIIAKRFCNISKE